MPSSQTLQSVASVAEIIAAVGVMISIIYLAIQVRHSNRQSRLQSHSDTLHHMHAPIQQIIAQPELAEIIRSGGISPDTLTETEWFKFSYYYLMQFNMYEFLYAAHFDESTAPQIWTGTDASWRKLFHHEPGVRKAWREWRHAFTDPFQSYIDDVVNDAEKPKAQ